MSASTTCAIPTPRSVLRPAWISSRFRAEWAIARSASPPIAMATCTRGTARMSMPWINSSGGAHKMLQLSLHKKNYILNSILGDGNENATQTGSHSNAVPETGLEPVRGCPQRFLSLTSISARHCVLRLFGIRKPSISFTQRHHMAYRGSSVTHHPAHHLPSSRAWVCCAPAGLNCADFPQEPVRPGDSV
jgi:hypothetical protein